MGTFLQVVSGVYFMAIWGVAFMTISRTDGAASGYASPVYVVLIALAMTLPAAALYAFGRMVNDTRDMKNSLAQMLTLLREGR